VLSTWCSFETALCIPDKRGFFFESLPLQSPLLEPNKPVSQALIFGMPGKEFPTIFARESLSSSLFTPANYAQAATGPTPVFFCFFMNKKSLLKPVSVNFL
jgi:hypothetical protein